MAITGVPDIVWDNTLYSRTVLLTVHLWNGRTNACTRSRACTRPAHLITLLAWNVSSVMLSAQARSTHPHPYMDKQGSICTWPSPPQLGHRRRRQDAKPFPARQDGCGYTQHQQTVAHSPVSPSSCCASGRKSETTVHTPCGGTHGR